MADSSSLASTSASSRRLLGDEAGPSFKTAHTATAAPAADDSDDDSDDDDDSPQASTDGAETPLELPDFSLDPFDPPLGFAAAYIRSDPTTLCLTEACASVGRAKEIAVRDITHNVDVLRRYARPFNLHLAKEYRDAETGEPVLTVKLDWDAKVFRMKLSGKGPSDEPLFKAVSKMGLQRAELKASFKNVLSGDGADVQLVVTGGYVKGDALIQLADTGRVLAVIRRATNWNAAADHLTANGQFNVTVAPGVDLALIVGLCNAWDEKRWYG